MSKYEITDSDIELFKNLRDCGTPLKQIERMFPYNQAKARYIVRTLKKQYHKTRLAEKMLFAYNKGATIDEIAEEYESTESLVRTYLRREGVKFTDEPPTTQIVNDLIRGVPRKQICEKYGVTRQWVYYCHKTYISRILPTTD